MSSNCLICPTCTSLKAPPFSLLSNIEENISMRSWEQFYLKTQKNDSFFFSINGFNHIKLLYSQRCRPTWTPFFCVSSAFVCFRSPCLTGLKYSGLRWEKVRPHPFMHHHHWSNFDNFCGFVWFTVPAVSVKF